MSTRILVAFIVSFSTLLFAASPQPQATGIGCSALWFVVFFYMRKAFSGAFCPEAIKSFPESDDLYPTRLARLFFHSFSNELSTCRSRSALRAWLSLPRGRLRLGYVRCRPERQDR